MASSPKIVLLGGGTGSFTLLQGLKLLTPELTAIVSMSDDGGSTGLLRDELGVLPPGDIRQCLVALSDNPEVRNLFSYRFNRGSFKGQSLGNIILSGLELQHGSLEKAITVAGTLLGIRGSVTPVSLTPHRLVMRDGRRTIRGEGKIDEHHIAHENAQLWLEPAVRINPAAERAIVAADMVVIAPGSFYGSLAPILLVEGVTDVLRHSKARIISVANLVNKPGQCDDWHVVDYVRHLEQYLGAGAIDVVLYNNQPITPELLKKYAAEGEFPVRTDPERFAEIKARAVGARLVSPDIMPQDPADTATRRTLIRHDAAAVCGALEKIVAIH